MVDFKALEKKYKEFANLEEVAYYSSQELNTDLVGCIRDAMTKGDIEYVAKFTLQHLNHFIVYCAETYDFDAKDAMQHLIKDLYEEHGWNLSKEVRDDLKELSGRELFVLYGEFSRTDNAQRLAQDLDAFGRIHDTYNYMDAVGDVEQDISETAQMIEKGDVIGLKEYLQEFIDDDHNPEAIKDARKLLSRLEDFEAHQPFRKPSLEEQIKSADGRQKEQPKTFLAPEKSTERF